VTGILSSYFIGGSSCFLSSTLATGWITGELIDFGYTITDGVKRFLAASTFGGGDGVLV
jgi:hypothetical protein